MKNLVVIGSGVMGRGIAYVSAIGGFEVIVVDNQQAQLDAAQSDLLSIFDKAVERGKMTSSVM
ncbi:MAG: 3-hydroxyacyl-CoA dehydrogenase NAD-binding domain-containing protein, partial [Bacillota bacterium]|nr:3-hydroxyacyl-CoA dehydrogenase NAD-binding domain-containing protein [Bacillota bacterium]